MASVKKLADAIFNDVVDSLRGYHQNISLSKELLEEEVVQTRLLVLKEYMIKGILPVNDLLLSLNCVPVDCDSLDKCKCSGTSCGNPTAHFLIPQILFDYGLNKAISYIGSTDRLHPFLIYNKPIDLIKTYLKYRKRGKNKPWVYIDVTPNSDGLIDCYIFGAPLIQLISVTAIFKDLRQVEEYLCACGEESLADENLSFFDILIKDKLTQLKLRYYRQFLALLKPNNQEYT